VNRKKKNCFKFQNRTRWKMIVDQIKENGSKLVSWTNFKISNYFLMRPFWLKCIAMSNGPKLAIEKKFIFFFEPIIGFWAHGLMDLIPSPRQKRWALAWGSIKPWKIIHNPLVPIFHPLTFLHSLLLPQIIMASKHPNFGVGSLKHSQVKLENLENSTMKEWLPKGNQ
jgi:hypothetical protein